MTGEWLTYQEVAVRLGVTPEAARRQAIRGKWARMPGNDGQTRVRLPDDWRPQGAGLHLDEMDIGGSQIMMMAPAWTAQYAAMVFLMWIIMMAAMMLPSAAPAILLVAALTKHRGERHAIRASGVWRFGAHSA
jgi:predicted metal-binding membrane protein